eukprot:gene11247-12547_t
MVQLFFILAALLLIAVTAFHSLPQYRLGVQSSLHHGVRRTSNLAMTATSKNARKRVVVVGATGYIGKFVAQESIRRGHETIVVVRPSASEASVKFFEGAKIVYGDVCDEDNLKQTAFKEKVDVVISCLASRSGVKEDSFRIDYQATLNSLHGAIHANADQFILLSAFCVRKPLLQFQLAKLKFEEALIQAQKEQKIAKFSIVRPTAFFKSVSGQFELLQQGWPFVMFGNGEICRCNPIAESDLATYMLDCIEKPDRWNKVLNLGGPDEGLTMKQQGEMLFEVLGKEPKFWTAPVVIFDIVIGMLAALGKIFPKMEDAAELGRIGKYYAVEDMWTTVPEEKFGSTTLRQHYERIKEEGQEYDPYTTMFSSKKN